jgi:hypothetical protein
MKKIDFNIPLPEEDFFNEALFARENPDLYQKYLIKSGEENKMKRIENTISNMLTRALNKVEIDKKDYTEKPTASTAPPDHCSFANVINAIRKEKEGWVKLENADFDFLKKKWGEAKSPVYKNTALTLAAINEAIEIAAAKRGNSDDKEPEMIE